MSVRFRHPRPMPAPARLGLAMPVAMMLLAALVTACGGQIPFGTPRPTTGPTAPPTATDAPSVPPATAPSSPGSGGPSAVPTETPPPTDAPLPTPPTVAVTYRVAGTPDLRITLPPGWVGFDAQSPEAAVLATQRERPELAEALGRLGSGVVFVAYDASATGEGEPPSLAITAPGAVPQGPLLRSLAENTAAQIRLSQPVDGDVELVPLDLPSGTAFNLRYALRAEGDAAPLALDTYILTVGQMTYIATFAAPAAAMEGFRPAFAEIVASMEAPAA